MSNAHVTLHNTHGRILHNRAVPIAESYGGKFAEYAPTFAEFSCGILAQFMLPVADFGRNSCRFGVAVDAGHFYMCVTRLL